MQGVALLYCIMPLTGLIEYKLVRIIEPMELQFKFKFHSSKDFKLYFDELGYLNNQNTKSCH